MNTVAGYKTYIIAALIAVATGVKYLGYIDEGMYQTLLALLGAGGLASMRKSVENVDKKLPILILAFLLFPSTVFAQAPNYYVLKADSVYKNVATDGTDLGANTNFKKIDVCATLGASSPECLAFDEAPQQNPPATATQKFGWDQPAGNLAEAQALTYKYYADGSLTGVAFTGVVCTGTTSPFQCSAPIPAFTPGNHSITMTASNVAGESAKSVPFAFNFVVTPGVPLGIRIIGG